MTAKEKVFYFWGVMDAVGAVYYSYGSWEFLGGSWVLATVNLGMIFYLAMFGGVDEMLKGTYYLIYTLTPLTLILSSWFFFKKKYYAVEFAMVQEIFRIIALRCSLPLLPMIVSGLGWSGLTINISILVFSEILKIGSLIYVIKKQPATNITSESK
ncbi:hypothetical protein [Enterobacter huaxiensis]|jgi:hypothetical protein|uniref:hypothetical protein n=1 Tax=Enterobacter huaxiensis TaxID=2494702 RepID=UPI0021D9F233|nr:hypothetical protein [Enterobacter huaxiensis]